MTLVPGVLFALALAVADDPTGGLRDEDVARLRKGDIILLPTDGAGGQAKRLRAALVFAQPVTTSWAVLSHPEHEDEYLDDCDSAELIQRDENGRDTVEYTLSVMLSTIRYRVNHTYVPAEHRFSWALDPQFDNDLALVEGEWRLYAWEGKTLARFATRVDVSSLIPDFIQRRLARRDVPRSLEAVRKRVNSGGTWKKD